MVHRANLGTVSPGRPAAPGDRYLLMSMTKAFTAVVVHRWIEQGRFGLETRVDDVLPGFGVKGKENATIRQLLCHTSGLPTAPVPPPLPMTAGGDLPRKTKAIKALRAGVRAGYPRRLHLGTGYDALGQILVENDPSTAPTSGSCARNCSSRSG